MLLSGPIGTQKCQGLNTVQRRMKSTTLLEEMTKITDYANPSETVMLQAFNWESHKAGRGDWYGIVASKLQMFKETWLDLAFRLPTPDLTLSRVFLQIRLKTAEVTARYTNIIRSHPTHPIPWDQIWYGWAMATGPCWAETFFRQDMGITDLWLPPCTASVAPQGYLPSQLFNLDGSKYGNKDESLMKRVTGMTGDDRKISQLLLLILNFGCLAWSIP